MEHTLQHFLAIILKKILINLMLLDSKQDRIQFNLLLLIGMKKVLQDK